MDINEIEARFTANNYSITNTETFQLAIQSINAVALAQLATVDDEAVREEVAANVNTSVETLLELSTDEDEGVRNYVAANSNTPVESLRSMMVDGVTWDYFIAQNPNTPADMRMAIAKRGDSYDAQIAMAKSDVEVPVELALALLKSVINVRKEVAKRKDLTFDTIQRLINDREEEVIKAVVQNPVVPMEALQAIVKGGRTKFISQLASDEIKKRREAMNEAEETIFKGIIGNFKEVEISAHQLMG